MKLVVRMDGVEGRESSILGVIVYKAVHLGIGAGNPKHKKQLNQLFLRQTGFQQFPAP